MSTSTFPKGFIARAMGCQLPKGRGGGSSSVGGVELNSTCQPWGLERWARTMVFPQPSHSVDSGGFPCFFTPRVARAVKKKTPTNPNWRWQQSQWQTPLHILHILPDVFWMLCFASSGLPHKSTNELCQLQEPCFGWGHQRVKMAASFDTHFQGAPRCHHWRCRSLKKKIRHKLWVLQCWLLCEVGVMLKRPFTFHRFTCHCGYWIAVSIRHHQSQELTNICSQVIPMSIKDVGKLRGKWSLVTIFYPKKEKRTWPWNLG